MTAEHDANGRATRLLAERRRGCGGGVRLAPSNILVDGCCNDSFPIRKAFRESECVPRFQRTVDAGALRTKTYCVGPGAACLHQRNELGWDVLPKILEIVMGARLR